MNIAVIGDYESPDYQVLIGKVKNIFPQEKVYDLSRHLGNNWKKKDDARIGDISDSHLVIICNRWQEYIDARHDLSEAQKLHKDISLEISDSFIPFPNNR